MALARWLLAHDRPVIEIMLQFAQGGQKVVRTLLADTGAGEKNAPFEILLDENDCLLCGGKPLRTTSLRGAYSGSFPVYLIPVEIPLLNFQERLPAIGVSTLPPGLDGIACFRFLNRFTYGNFANPSVLGLQT